MKKFLTLGLRGRRGRGARDRLPEEGSDHAPKATTRTEAPAVVEETGTTATTTATTTGPRRRPTTTTTTTSTETAPATATPAPK